MTLSFRLTITSLVMVILVTLALMLIGLQYRILTIAVHTSAGDSMASVSERVATRIDARLANTVKLVNFLSAIPSIADQRRPGVDNQAIELFRMILEQAEGYESVYVGYADGYWLQLLRVSELTPEQRQMFQTPDGAVYILNQVFPGAPGQLPLFRRFLDADMQMISEITIPHFGYDARTRPWYLDAKAHHTAAISRPYRSYASGESLITVSAELDGVMQGVVGIDIQTVEFSHFVSEQAEVENTVSVAYMADGTLLAHPQYSRLLAKKLSASDGAALPTIADLDDGLVKDALADSREKAREAGGVHDDKGSYWLYRIGPLHIPDFPGAHIVLIAEETDFAGDIRRLQWRGFLVACAIGAIFLPVSWFAASRISRQLLAITDEANRLQTMQTPPDRPIGSLIKEIRNLGEAVHLAQKAIWSFSRFVPSELVRRLLKDEMSTEIGGVRQGLSVVFTDVENFTTIAESTDPNLLMSQTSRYFSALTDAFLAEGGTIDKFIGDAVMVFWNAPEPQDDHVKSACRAVLAAREASETINRQFEAEGLPRFRTRFGVNTGVAVVGNLGSSERMNYTALGNTVNLAARLESLNKEYDTDILVSEAVRDQAGDTFTFRKVDRTIAKGMTHATTVYELVGEQK